MKWRARHRLWLALTLAMALTVVAVALCGCGVRGGASLSGVKFSDEKMIHLQQVLERYDGEGNAVPQYLELWLTDDRGRCSELDAEGVEIAVALETGKEHLYYDPATLHAQKSGESRLFIVNLQAMKKAYPKVKSTNDGKYAGRNCTFYLLTTGKDAEWVKLYVDKQTGYVLLCDSETFRLRTALIEEIPADESLFEAPAGLDFEGGDMK